MPVRWPILCLMTVAACAQEPQWRSLPIRSQAEAEAGLPGGEAEQHLQGMCRAASRPDRIYLSHDVGQVWRSDDNGRSWRHTGCRGMGVRAGQSIAADPVNADVVLAIVSRAWDYLAREQQGLYRSEDGGASWTLVLRLPEVDHQRSMQHTIACDPTTLGPAEARRWYAGFAGQGLYVSEDGGRTWTRRGDLSAHRPLYFVQAGRAAGTVYVGSSKGLFSSRDGGASFAPLGDLPAGGVRSLDLNPADPLDLHATVDGQGLFRSRDGGLHFALVKAFNAAYAVVHPTRRERVYLVGRGNAHMLTSDDGGASWVTPKVIPLPGWGRETGGTWKRSINGDFSWLLPDPRDAQSAVGIANATLYRTDDGGRTFTDTSAGFTGYAWGWYDNPVAFDRADSGRFAFFCFDVGMTRTDNGGTWFTRRGVPWIWVRDKRIAHTGMHTGSYQPLPGSQVVVATAGLYWKEVIVRSADDGRTWTIVDGEARHNLFVSFHGTDPNVVYADTKRSDDAGLTWQPLANLPADCQVLGMAPSRPDTIYAMNTPRTELHRSDDRGATWRLYTKPGWALRRLDAKPTFAVSPANPDLIYSVDARGDLARYDGREWRSLGVLDLAGGQREQGNFVSRVAIDPRHPEILYAGLNACGRSLVYRSTDGGARWTDLSGNLPRIGAGGLIVHPLTGDVFLGGICGTRVLAPPYASLESISAELGRAR